MKKPVHTLVIIILYSIFLYFFNHLFNPNQIIKTTDSIPFKFNYFLINQSHLDSKNAANVSKGEAFIQSLINNSSISWDEFQQAADQENYTQLRGHINILISHLTPYLTKEPNIPINQKCSAPPLKQLEGVKCNETKPKKIGLLLQFGFDVDGLEIHLNELYDVVDKFFIIESTHTHSRAYLKPLIWDRVKFQTRFIKFLDKIVHFIVDDAQVAKVYSEIEGSSAMSSFDTEHLQEKLRWKKFLQWNTITKYFTKSDLLGFGDNDEIASRDVVYHLKHCQLESDPLDIGIWFPFGAIDQAFLTDFPLYEHPFSLGDPSFWTLETALNQETVIHFNLPGYPSRNRGNSRRHLLGGMHMSHYLYLPHLIVKAVAQSEGSFLQIKTVSQFPELSRNSSLEDLIQVYSDTTMKKIKFRIFKLNKVSLIDPEQRKIAVLPWFYNCNRDRYPSWERKHDSRLDWSSTS